MSVGGERSAPRGEATTENAVNEMNDEMAKMSIGGAGNELIGETTGSAVSARGDATATASGADGDGATTTVDGETTKDDDDDDASPPTVLEYCTIAWY